MTKNIIETILSTYDLSLSNEDRRKKFEIINNYQENEFTLDDLKVLLGSNANQQVKIFGFNCLENFILYKWNSADKGIAKSYLIEIIKEYGNFVLDASAERVVRWIIAKTMVYFIRHECPQNCDSIVEDLINLKVNGIMTKALILSIFFCLSETLPNDCQMPEKRKKEVMIFVTKKSHVIISFCIDIVHEHFQRSQVEVINITYEAIKAIQSLSTWIRYESLESITESIFVVILNSLVVDSSDYYLMEVLETIFERKFKPDERYHLFSKMIQNRNLWHKFIANISTGLRIPLDPYSDDKFRYLQKMFDLLLIIGNLTITNWEHFEKEVSSLMISDLFDLILIASHHPIKILSVEFLSFWSNGFKSEKESLRTVLVAKAQSLLPLLKSMSIKQNIRDPNNVDYEYLNNLIEDSESEAYISRIRMEISKTVAVLTQYFTEDILALVLEWVLTIVNTVKEMEERDLQALKTITSDSALLKELEASRYFTRSVMHSIFKPYSKNIREVVQNLLSTCSPDIISRSRTIITSIIGYNDINISISNTYLETICLLLPIMAGDQEIIEQCIEKIFKWFTKVESADSSSPEYMLLKQQHLDCGIWLLRVFRDYNFLIPAKLFESIVSYHHATCSPLHSRANIIEALTQYICHSGNYNDEQKKALLLPYINSIKSVICSDQVLRVFGNGVSIINYLQMERPKPEYREDPNYPSADHVNLRTNVSNALGALLGLCRRLSIDQNETESRTLHPKLSKSSILVPCPVRADIMTILPSLFVIIRSLNQIWSAGIIHSDFNSLMEVSTHFRENLIKNKTNAYIRKSYGDAYVSVCQSLLSKLQETAWNILAKCCLNFGEDLYAMSEWSQGIVEYVFADLDSLPNFKLMSLIKIFLIPFVQYCPTELAKIVLVNSIIPFVNYLFPKLGEKWSLVNNVCSTDTDNECDMEQVAEDDNSDLTNEIIEEQILRTISRTFVNLFRLTMSLGCAVNDDTSALGAIADTLCDLTPGTQYPMILILLNHVCHSITWKDSYCSSKLCQMIMPFAKHAHVHGLLSIDVIIFILQQSVTVLNIFAGSSYSDIRLTITNLGVYLYEEHLTKDPAHLERFVQLLDKSSSKEIHTFKHKMLPASSAKVKREAFQSILRPYIGVPTNEMFSQKVCIRNLPPLLKPEWHSKNQRQLSFDGDEPLCLSNLFE